MHYHAFLVGLLVALPALAQDGFKVGVNAGLMKSSINNPTQVGSYFGSSDGNSWYKPVTAKYGNATPLGFTFGYRAGANEFALEYTSLSRKKSTAYAYDPEASYDLETVVSYDEPFTSATKLKAEILDLHWKHAFTTGTAGTFSTIIGGRFAKYRNQLNLNNTYANDYGTTDYDIADLDFKTSGFGLLVGASYNYPFTDKLSLGADVKFAFIQGNDQSTYRERYSFTYEEGIDAFTESGEAPKQTRSFSQSDLHVHLDWAITRRLGASIGYRYLDFGKVASLSGAYSGGARFARVMKAKDSGFGSSEFQPSTGWSMAGVTFGLSCTF